MENEFSEKLLNILLEISKNLEQVPFWEDYTFWITSISVVVLSFTLIWLVRYTHATEKMAEYQVMPAVDVNMIYEKSVGKTYFWFLNTSSIPAFVTIKIDIKNEGEHKEQELGPLRISPYHPHYPQFKKTATSFDFLEGDSSRETEVVLNITVTPAFDNGRIKFNFTKSYGFDKSELQWNETSWNYPDPPFPVFRNQKNEK